MENLRVVLAAAALLIGGVLLLAAIFRRKKATSASSANWIFGVLFLTVAAVLWIRGSNESSLSDSPTLAEKKQNSAHPVDDDEPAMEGLASGRSPGRQTAASDDPATNSMSSATGASVKSATIPPTVSLPAKHKSIPSRSIEPLRVSPVENESSTAGLSWEYRILAAVEASFTWIEEFFDEYGSPAPSESSAKSSAPIASQMPSIEFPEVKFAESSADLTAESLNQLRILATRLTAEYPNSSFEIQAYVRNVGPEAFNFVLTQARADAVRDFLITEGVNENRLIARGYGTGKDPDLADARIEFIVKR